MRQKLPTLLILLVMLLVGAMYWVDLAYYTSPVTGFNTRGQVWYRYAVLALPLAMCLLGLRTVGPRAISVLRIKNPVLGWLFGLAAVVGIAWGGTRIVFSLAPVDWFSVILGLANIWYGVWMFLACLQLFTQSAPAPTRSAVWGVAAALPFALTTVRRILVSPSSLFRVGLFVRAFAGLALMLWCGLLLRSFYIALPRKRVRWMYLFGVFSFLLCTCLELPLAVFAALFGTPGQGRLELFESVNMGAAGLVAGAMSVAIAGRSESAPQKKPKGDGEDGAAPEEGGGIVLEEFES